MKLFDTLKNIWKIEELKTRILTTLGLILVYRLGTEVHFRMLRSLPWELCPISLLLS